MDKEEKLKYLKKIYNGIVKGNPTLCLKKGMRVRATTYTFKRCKTCNTDLRNEKKFLGVISGIYEKEKVEVTCDLFKIRCIVSCFNLEIL